MKVQRIYTQKISKDLLNSIILLKKSHWNFDLKSQFTWFKNNCFKNDIHFLCFIKDKLVGYGHLGVRTFFPKAKCFGYQGFTCFPQYMCLNPTKSEYSAKVVPEVILSIGKIGFNYFCEILMF